MDEYVVYVLYSDRYGKHYVGYTSDLIDRFASHNRLATKGWTVAYRPWRVLFVEFHSNKREALAREKWLKSGKGREFIKTLQH